MILTAWVGFSTVFCLALFGLAANSIPSSDELRSRDADSESPPSMPQSLAAHCPVH
jgi:hypothetical protein